MDPETQKLIDEQFKVLPEPLQKAITNSPWREWLGTIAKSNNLSDAQKESLETETMLVIYGFEGQTSLVDNISRELAIDISRAITIADTIDKQVLSKILEKANEPQPQEQRPGTLKSMPETKTESTPLATGVVVEKHSELPSGGGALPKTNLTFEERKKLVPNIPDNKGHYGDKIDPYREPI